MDEDCLRIVSANTGSMGQSCDDPQNESLCASIRKYRASITLLQELRNNWKHQSRKNQWRPRLEKYLDPAQTRTRVSCNRNDQVKDTKQYGGTGIVTYGKLSHYACGSDEDPTKLGRWTWSRYRGKNNQYLRCVSIYRPCSDDTGEESVCAQHTAYFKSKDDDRRPRQAFVEDLETELSKWINEGDHIIIGGDINESVLDGDMKDLFDRFSMRNLVFDLHDHRQAPATYNRNQNGKIVDGLWGTPLVSVKRAGFLEAGDFPGDHAAIWADVTCQSVLGYDPPHPQHPMTRRLRLFDTNATKRFRRIYDRLINSERLEEKLQEFEASWNPDDPLTPQQIQTLENIDQLRTKCLLKAEKMCRQLRTGAVEFSEATAIPRRQIEFWNLALRRKKKVKVSTRLWRRKKKAAKITQSLKDYSEADIKKELQDARKTYREAKKNDAAARIAFIDTFAPKDRDRIKKREEAARLGKLVGTITGKRSNKTVLSVQDTQGNTYTTEETVVPAIASVNEAKTRASSDTPFLQELLPDFGTGEYCQAIEEVLEGIYNPPEESSAGTKLLLRQMAMPEAVKKSKHAAPTEVTTEDHVRSWARAKESTSAGPSGLHFGMFKANAKDPTAARIDAKLRNIAYKSGYVYERWCHGVDVQILKRSGDYRIEKLRTILLLEADFNMNNKKMGRELMWKAERDGTLAKDNYGGRKNLRAVEVALNQCLTFNSIWARRGRAVVLSNDAKGCYDRIAHLVAFICLLRLGTPKAPILSVLRTIRRLRHYIRTGFGTSEQYYGGDEDDPLQGLLQGNGMAPPGWSAISAVLINAMKAMGFGYEQWTAISQRAVEITCFAFVDDTDLIHAIDEDLPTSQLIKEAQEVLATWEDLLRATGGALAPEKSYWYLIEVIHKNGRWQYKNPEDDPGDIFLTVKDEDGAPWRSSRLPTDHAKEALGIWGNPKCDTKTQVQKMQQKVSIWCDSIRTRKLTKNEAWHCFTSSIIKTIEYPLMATTLSQDELKTIMSPLLRVILPMSGYQRNLPRKLVYGSLQAQGCNLHDPWVTQLIEHLQAILRHATRDTPTGSLLRENMELVQVHVGSATPFWLLQYEKAGCLAPEGWVQHTWEALQEYPIELQGPLATLPALREHDQHLMDIFRNQGNVSNEEQITLNNCRIFLGVTRLSEICTANGQEIRQDMMEKPKPTPARSRQKRQWPKAYKPKKADWELWKNKLRATCLHPQATHRRLRQPLGQWHNAQDDIWQWWYSPSQQSIWEHTSDNWRIWQHRFRPNGELCFNKPAMGPHQNPQLDLPHDARRVTVRSFWNGKSVRILHQGTTTEQAQHFPESLQQALQQLPCQAHWAVERTNTSDNGQTIADALAAGTAVAVSDGSLKHNTGTAAYVIEGQSHEHRIKGVNIVPGPIKDGDSYRCELSGLYAIVLMCNTVARYFHLPTGRCKIYCDNISALRVFEVDYNPDPTEESFDLASATWNLIQESPIQWEPHHVKGHQDDVSLHALSRTERLNCEMDELAKTFRRHVVEHDAIDIDAHPRQLHGEGWSIRIQGHKIICPDRNNLYPLLQDPITIDWWVRHGRLQQEAVPLIEWKAAAEASKKLPKGIRRWTTKHSSKNCGCGTTLLKWKKQLDDKCPRCGVSETTDHVLKCNGYDADKKWDDFIETLTQTLYSLDTDPRLQMVMLQGVQNWRAELPIDTGIHDTTIQALIDDQTTIGWDNLLLGLPSNRWKQLQQRHYNRHQDRRTGKQWLVKILKCLRIGAFGQWEHRNDIKHVILKPRHKQQVEELHRQIFRELQTGVDDLPTGDHYHFNLSFMVLTQRSLKYKQHWIINVTHARQRQARKRALDGTETEVSRKRSRLIQWIETGRCS